MKLTLEVPDSLGKRLHDYLKDYPEETLLSLVQTALETKLISQNINKPQELAENLTEIPEQLNQQDPWEVFLNLGNETEPGQLKEASINHDRYLYKQP